MMSVALPWVLAASGLAVLVIGVLHLLSVRRPPELILPTARFVPDREVRAVSRTAQPSDVLLLVLRVAALLSAGVAGAGLSCATGTASSAILVVRDVGVDGDSASLTRAVQGARDGGREVVVASVPYAQWTRPINAAEAAAVFPIALRTAHQMLIGDAAVRAVDLHVFTTRAPNESDIAWRAWRSTWPGRVTVHTRAASDTTSLTTDSARGKRTVWLTRAQGAVDDAIVDGFKAAGIVVTGDSLHAPADAAHVVWPRAEFTPSRRAALVAAGAVLPGQWSRADTPLRTDSARAIAWWSDGSVAASERRTTAGCTRDVAIAVDNASDAVLSAEARELFRALAAPCVTASAPTPLSALTRTIVNGQLPATRAALALDDADRRSPTTWWTVGLLSLAIALLLLERRLRDASSGRTEVVEREAERVAARIAERVSARS